MRKPNGYGSIKKLSGNRRRPFVYVISKNGKLKAVAYFVTQIEAEVFAADYNKKHKNYSLPAHEITFAELFYRWFPFHIEKYQPAKSTVCSYKNAFNHCQPLHQMSIKQIKYFHLQQIIDDMRRHGLSYSSCKKVRSLMSLLFKYGIIMEYCNKNYAPLINLGKNKSIRPHKVFSRQKINRLWANLHLPNVDTVLILIYTGMRIGELLALEKSNVYLRQKYIKIVKSKTKSGLRNIPIHEKILPLVVSRMNSNGKHLICTKEGKAYNYTSYCFLWEKVMKAINGNHTTHDCRHTCATLLDNAEANENAKRRILGHATGDVTDTVYTHKNLKQLRKAINKIK